MTSVRVDFELSQDLQNLLDNYPEIMQKIIDSSLRSCGDEMRNMAGTLAPFKSGNLRRSITMDLSKESVVVGTNLEYARIHDQGGEIRAKNKPFLAFKINGQWIRTKSVKIPKYKGRGYITPTFNRMKEGLAGEIFLREIKRAI